MKKYDLNLGKWGPYNKEYLGILHIADENTGTTFNVELFPGFFRRSVMAPYSIGDCGVKMWGANAELTHFCYRYELEWKDKVYCDAEFNVIDDCRCDIECTFVNNTEFSQSVNMNMCTSLQKPAVKRGGLFLGYKKKCDSLIGSECVLKDAVEYDEISCGHTMAWDGLYLGEEQADYATGKGTVIGGRFFNKPSHYLIYSFDDIVSDSVGIRCNAPETAKIQLVVNDEFVVNILADKSVNFEYYCAKINETKIKKLEIRTDKAVNIDCLCVGKNAEKTEFKEKSLNFEASKVIEGNSITLNFDGIDHTYNVECHYPVQMMRRFYCSDIANMLKKFIHEHVSYELRGTGDGVYDIILTEPIYLEPGEKKTIKFTVSTDKTTHDLCDKKAYKVHCNHEGKKYEFSQNMMAYNTFLNVVYPVYTRRQYIRHNTPGRNWDSLYSWDSGFIGMGLGTADFNRAFDCLYTYLTPDGDVHSPYIFHGSVMPTQIFLYKYLIDKYPEKRDRLKEIYPMMMQYFRFYANMDKGENQLNSGIIKTWHIFYNSSVGDDYPPQYYMHNNKEGKVGAHNTTPVVTSATTVLIAKIMKLISLSFGMKNTEEFDAVAKKYSDAVLKYLWDDECGYFSYMVHDENGNPKEFLRYKDGSNYNMGFDGISPYIAGITTEEQSSKIFDNIKNGLMTDIGISVVDKRATYFSDSGYWNGSVWMPFQWILWMSLINKGEWEFAKTIANTALNVWKKEVDYSYSCFENFMISNGRGSGFHQFSGLSTPVLMFFESYYTPGTITVGFEVIVENSVWNKEKTSAEINCISLNKNTKILVCMKAGEYSATVNGKVCEMRKISDGAFEISLNKEKNHIVIS